MILTFIEKMQYFLALVLFIAFKAISDCRADPTKINFYVSKAECFAKQCKDKMKGACGGDQYNACKNIDDIADKVKKWEKDERISEVVIYLDGTPAKKNKQPSYNLKEIIKTTRISIKIRSWKRDYIPLLTLANGVNHLIHVKNESIDSKSQIIIEFKGIEIRGKSLALVEAKIAKVIAIKCRIYNAKSVIDVLVEKMNVMFNDLHCSYCTKIIDVKTSLVNSIMFINGSVFIGAHGRSIGFNSNTDKKNSFLITHTTFENINNPLNIKFTCPELKNSNEKSAYNKSSNNFRLKNCIIKNNGRPVTFRGGWCTFISILKTDFINNNQGALNIEGVGTVTVGDSNFDGNSNNSGILLKNVDSIRINATKFNNNSNNYNGGAICAKESFLVVQNCMFNNNFASSAGGAIYQSSIDAKRHLKLENTTFNYSGDKLPNGGLLVYSSSQITVKNISAKLSNDRMGAARYAEVFKSDHKRGIVVAPAPFNVQCPENSNVDIPKIRDSFKTMSDEEFENKKKENTDLKQYRTFTVTRKIGCISCPKDKYTLHLGSLSTSIKKIKNSTFVRYVFHNQQCSGCPVGGDCSEHIKSQDNFWGFRKGDKLEFIQCPRKYCCSRESVQCESINTCNANREGSMCGMCKAGYTMDFFSDRCIVESSCAPGLFWIIRLAFSFAVVGSLCYVDRLFLGVEQIPSKFINFIQRRHQGPDNRMKDRQEAAMTSSEIITTEDQNLINCDDLDNSSNPPNDGCGEREKHIYRDDDLTAVDFGEANVNVNCVNSNVSVKQDNVAKKQQLDIIYGVLKIMFLFYQTEQYLNASGDGMVGLFPKIFRFQFMSESSIMCPMSNLSAFTKEFIYIFTYLLNICVAIVMYTIVTITRKSTSELRLRLKRCIAMLFVLSFIMISDHSISTVKCLTVEGENRMYLDGETKCYSLGQGFMIMFIVMWVGPFPFAVDAGLRMLRSRQITPNRFYAMLACPFYCLYSFLVARKKHFPEAKLTEKQENEVMFLLEMFYGPFRTTDTNGNPMQFPVNWEPMLLYGKLAMSLLCNLINVNIYKLSATLVGILVFLFLHIKYKPYNCRLLNGLANGALFMLLWLNISKLLWEVCSVKGILGNSDLVKFFSILNILQNIIIVIPALVAVVTLGLIVVGKAKSVLRYRKRLSVEKVQVTTPERDLPDMREESLLKGSNSEEDLLS